VLHTRRLNFSILYVLCLKCWSARIRMGGHVPPCLYTSVERNLMNLDIN
jgi:hypothetical protein